MSTQNSRSRQVCALALATCLGSAAAAVFAPPPVLAPYPAPGGNSASYVGEPINVGGRVWSLGGFDPSAYAKLYYGVGDYTPAFPDFVPGVPKLTMDGTTDALAFDASISNLAQGVAGWSGTTQVVLYTGAPTVYTRFVLAVTDAAGNPLALMDPLPLGMPAALGGVLDVGGAYKAQWQFEAFWSVAAGIRRPAVSSTASTARFRATASSRASAAPSIGARAQWTLASMLAGLGVLGSGAGCRCTTHRAGRPGALGRAALARQARD